MATLQEMQNNAEALRIVNSVRRVARNAVAEIKAVKENIANVQTNKPDVWAVFNQNQKDKIAEVISVYDNFIETIRTNYPDFRD